MKCLCLIFAIALTATPAVNGAFTKRKSNNHVASSDTYFTDNAQGGKAPKCFIDLSGRTVVQYRKALHPSFVCHHVDSNENMDNNGAQCMCTLNHPTHHRGGCREFFHSSGKRHTIGGACDASGLDNSGRCYKLIKRAYKNNAHLRVTYAYLKEVGLTKSDFAIKKYTSSAVDSTFGGTGNNCGPKHGLKQYWWTYVSQTGGLEYPGVPGSCANTGDNQLQVSTVPDAKCDGDYLMQDVKENEFAAASSALLPGGDVGDVSSCQECANKCAKVAWASVFIIDGNPANAPGVSGAGTCAALATTPGTCHCYRAARYNQLQADAKHITGRVISYMTTEGCQGQTGANLCPSGTW